MSMLGASPRPMLSGLLLVAITVMAACSDPLVTMTESRQEARSPVQASPSKHQSSTILQGDDYVWYCGAPRPQEPVVAESAMPGLEMPQAIPENCTPAVMHVVPWSGNATFAMPEWPGTPVWPWPEDGGGGTLSPLLPSTGEYTIAERLLCPPSWALDVPRGLYCALRLPNEDEMSAFAAEADLLSRALDPVCRQLGEEIASGLSKVWITAGQISAPDDPMTGHRRSATGQYIPPSAATQGRWEVHIAAYWLDPANPSISTPYFMEKKVETLRHEFLHRMGIHENTLPYGTSHYAETWCAPGGSGRGPNT